MKSLIVPNDIQKYLLNVLLEKYNNSRTFKDSNNVKQVFCVKPEEIFPEYNDDFAGADSVKDFENDVAELERENLITLQRQGRVITRIDAVCENIPLFRKLIGADDKCAVLKKSEEILKAYMGRNEILDKICAAQLKRVNNFQTQSIAKDNNKLNRILKCLDFILQNKEEILERELSILLFGDSKLFKNELKTKVCSLLLQYSAIDTEFSQDEQGIKNDKILSRYFVVKEPTYYYFKGIGVITFICGTKLELSNKYPIALRSDSVSEIKSVITPCDTVMTVENLTSFNRIRSEDHFCLFLSGYNDSCKSDFLKKLYSDNPGKEWLHFGNTDPEGFYILHNLRTKTEIDFQPYLMGIAELKRFKKFCKKLEPNDLAKARSLTLNNIYSDTAQFMLDNNCKLEQEIISLKGI